MSDPAFCNMSATEDTAAKIREKSEAAAAQVREGAETAMRAVRRLRERLQGGWHRVSGCVAETKSRIPAVKQGLRDDAAYVADRARYYHENRPLSVLGAIAAAAFVLGIAIGLGRR